MQPIFESKVPGQRCQCLGSGQNSQISQRLAQDHQHVGKAEGTDGSHVLGTEALAAIALMFPAMMLIQMLVMLIIISLHHWI